MWKLHIYHRFASTFIVLCLFICTHASRGNSFIQASYGSVVHTNVGHQVMPITLSKGYFVPNLHTMVLWRHESIHNNTSNQQTPPPWWWSPIWQNRGWPTNAPRPSAILMASAVCWSNTGGISPACSGLLMKPLDAGIGQLLVPYHPSIRQGNRQANNNHKIHQQSWPFRWPSQCGGRIPCTSPNGGGPGLH